MMKQFLIFFSFVVLSKGVAQHLYYKNPDSLQLRSFDDTLRRVVLADSNSLIKNEFNYVLKFFPKMLVKNIRIEFKESIKVVKTKPLFSTILKSPDQRIYKITFSKATKSTLDSVIISNLSVNAQLGLIAKQISKVEDLSTGGLLDFVSWYFKQLTRRGKNGIERDAEERTLEVGLGHQLLALNTETTSKLNIDKWKSVKGYAGYVKYTKTPSMKPYIITELMSDLPVYVTQDYK